MLFEYIHFLFFENFYVLRLLIAMPIQYVKEVCILKFAHSGDVSFHEKD